MTSPTDIGKEPPKQRYTISTPDEFDETFVVERYADYWRRRAERAEGLLEKVTLRMDRHDYACASEHGLSRKRCDCGLLELRARVAAHFDDVKS